MGAGKLLEKGFRAYKASKAAKAADELAEAAGKGADEVIEVLDDVPYEQLKNSPPCFLAGTLVKTDTGEKEIEKLVVGNKVLSYNFEKEIIEEKTILNLYDNWTDTYFEIKTENSTVLATSKHLFWVDDLEKWIPAKELKVDHVLKNAQKEKERIYEIKKFQNVNVPTYNFEVEEHHNYFVGNFGLLVHNQNKPSLFESTTKNNVDFYRVVDADGKTVYVGQTQQGINTRFDQHIAEGSKKGNFKSEWGNPEKFKVEKVEIPKKGPLTPYEAHAWEKHLIEESKAAGNPIQNKANPIGETKYNKFKDLHNPC